MPDEKPGGGKPFSARAVNLAALGWGFAEATLFFLAPEILLTWVALDKARAAWIACLWALAGALVGGTLMYAWGMWDVGTALVAMNEIPAISRVMCDAVGEQVRTQGAFDQLLPLILGMPYKLYAVQAGAAHVHLAAFLVVSVLAYLVRFTLLTGLTVLVCRWIWETKLSTRRATHVLLWAAFYGWTFWNFWEP